MHQADCWRCFQQRKCLWNKLIQVEVFWFRRDQHVMKVTLVLLVHGISPGTSWSGLVRNIWIFNPTYIGAVFTSLTLLTRYQLASCVRLQCWAEKRPFPIVRALDNLVNGQPCLLNIDFIWKMYSPRPSCPDPYPLPLQPIVQPQMVQCPFFPVPPTAALPQRKPPSAGHPVIAALLRTAIQDSVLPCDLVNTSR